MISCGFACRLVDRRSTIWRPGLTKWLPLDMSWCSLAVKCVPLTLTTVLRGCQMPGVDLMRKQKQGVKVCFFALRTICLVSGLKLCVCLLLNNNRHKLICRVTHCNTRLWLVKMRSHAFRQNWVPNDTMPKPRPHVWHYQHYCAEINGDVARWPGHSKYDQTCTLAIVHHLYIVALK